MKYYTGVGSRKTPKGVQAMMTDVANLLASVGWSLRSGGAHGADVAFEKGVCRHGLSSSEPPKMEIYLPWGGFNDRWEDGVGFYQLNHMNNDLQLKARNLVQEIHPAPYKLSKGACMLHMRNCFQVLGQDLNTPSNFLICWGETDSNVVPKGGTRTAWVLAEKYGIPCFNLYLEEHKKKLENWLWK